MAKRMRDPVRMVAEVAPVIAPVTAALACAVVTLVPAVFVGAVVIQGGLIIKS